MAIIVTKNSTGEINSEPGAKNFREQRGMTQRVCRCYIEAEKQEVKIKRWIQYKYDIPLNRLMK